MDAIDRTAFVSRAARGGAGIALGAAAASLLAAPTGGATLASGPISDADLALARLAVATELLAVDFATQAVASGHFRGDDLKHLRRILFNEQEHLSAVSGVLTGAGQAAATADDLDIGYPDGTFASRTSIARVGVTLETISVGIYVGAAASFAAADLRAAAAGIAASESQHLGLFGTIAYSRPVGISFPRPLSPAAASDALAPFLS